MKGHRTDAVSLVFGLIFLAIVGWWLLGSTFSIGLAGVAWTVAIGLIVLGAFGLLGALRSKESRAGRDDAD